MCGGVRGGVCCVASGAPLFKGACEHGTGCALAVGTGYGDYGRGATLTEEVDFRRPGDVATHEVVKHRRAAFVDGRVEHDEIDVLQFGRIVPAEVKRYLQIA